VASDPKVKAELNLNAKQYEQALKSASKHTAAVDDSLKKTQKTAGLAGASWAKMGAAISVAGGVAVIQMKKAVDAASHLNESTSKMRVIFGAASKDIEKFAATSASSLGMSKRAAYDAASMMATFGKAAGLTGQQLTKFSTEMVTLSSDLGSFFDSSPDEAMAAIGSALRGETESIRRYGVLIDAAVLSNRALEMGIISNIKTALTPQQKALAAQAEILAQTKDAQGDFARTSDGLANSQRAMTGAMENASAALGEALLPVMAKGTQAVADIAEAFAGLPAPIRDTAAGLALTAAAVATLGPVTVGAVKGLRDMANGIKAYTTVTTTATVATDALTASSMRLGGTAGLAGLAKSLGIVGVGIAAVGGIAVLAKNQIDGINSRALDGMVASIKEADYAGKVLGSTLTVTFGGGEVATGIEEIAAAAGRSALKAKEAAPAFAALDQYLSDLPAGEAAEKVERLREATQGAGMSTADLNALLPTYTAKQKEAAGAAAEMTAEEQEKADALKASNEAAQKAIDLIFGYINAQMAAAGSADALLGAQDRLTKAHKENGDAIRENSAKSVANREALRSEMSMVLANAKALQDKAEIAGVGTAQAYAIGNAAIEEGRENLIKAAGAAGYSKKEVRKLLEEYSLLPPVVETKVNAEVDKALTDTQRLQNLINALDGRVARATVITTYNKIKAGGTGDGMATGGKITGPGTGTSDSIPAMLSDGEWVVPARAASRVGDRFMSALVDGRVAGFAKGKKGKKKKKPSTESLVDALVDDIQWQFDMGIIDAAAYVTKLQAQLKRLKPGSEAYEDLSLTVKRAEDDQTEKAAEEQAKAAEALQKAAADQQSAADQLKSKADGIASSITNALSLSQTQANGKKWTSSAMLGDFANRAKQARDFATMVSQLSSRGLSEDVINQVLSAGPVAGADMARALTRMSAGQLATVNANQGAINASGQWLGNALTYGNANAITVTLSGGAPVVLQLDSRAIYEGQLVLARQMGGSYALTGR
jgi:hypothetical protein